MSETRDPKVSEATEAADEASARAGHDADRAPTAKEERAADEAAGEVDLDEVAAHEREMVERGANVRGEGQIEP